MTLPRGITDGPDSPIDRCWRCPPGSSFRPDIRRSYSQYDAELIRLLLAEWDRLPVVVASATERDRIAARLTPGELERVDWLDEWPRMER